MSPTEKSFNSNIYTAITKLTDDNAHRLKSKWEEELRMELKDDWWKAALNRINSSSSCARLNFSKARLAEIYPGSNPKCDRCNEPHLTHMYWSCPQLQRFWPSVFDTLSTVLQTPLQPCPLLAIFGVSETLQCTGQNGDIIAFTTLLARRRLLLSWICGYF